MSELTFSFTDCTPVPREPQLVIPAMAPTEQSVITVRSTDNTAYTYVEKAGHAFRGWLTVTADAVLRNVVRAFRRVVCEAKVLFNRRVFFFAGGLRL